MIGSVVCVFKRMLRVASVSRLGLVCALSLSAALLPASASGAAVSAATTPLVFSSAQVGVASGSAQTLTETFTLTGYTSVISPTATMHYGLSYKLGAIACTGGVGSQTCTVSVTFLPKLPGGHRDAIFLMNGSTRIATVLVYGIGVSPLALLQPGIVTQSADQGTYLYTSIVAEDGTAYVVAEEGSEIFARSPAGVITTLPITGLDSPRAIGIDGAGLLYIADQTGHGPIKTYDTVTGVQGTFPFPSPDPGYIQSVTVNNTGTVYEADYSNIYVFAPGVDPTTIAINPSITQPSAVAVDSAGNLFIGGYTVDEMTAGGTQSQVNSAYGVGSVYLDAADTLYMNGTGRGLAEFPASDYTTAIGAIDASDSALGGSVGPDGTVFVGNYSILDVVDRSQSKIDFGNQTSGTQVVQLYNGGNAKLTISAITLTGPSQYTTAQPATPCTANLVLNPGALCNLTVNFSTTVPGSFNGAVTFTTNSLNTTSASVVTLTAAISGAYMVPSPASLDFGSVTDGTTSATKTITLTNDGYAVAAQVYSPGSADPAFTVTLGTCNNVNVAVGDSCKLNVTFSPTAVQPYSSTGSTGVTNDGPGGAPPVSFTLAGTGVSPTLPPPPPVANLQFTPAIINIVAGTGTSGYTGDNGPAAAAELQGPNGLVYDAAGNLYISDGYNNRVRKVDTSGTITTFAGNGTPGDTGDSGAAASAELNRPAGLAFDAAGNLYIADSFNNVIRKVDTGGTITTFAGTGTASYTGDGHAATAATFNEPLGLAFDATGNLYIGDAANHVVRMIDTAGNVSTFAGNGTSGYTGDGHAATSAELSDAEGVAVDSAGNVYIADSFNFVYRVVNKAGVISTFAGTGVKDGGCPLPGGNVPTTCTFSFPYTVYVSPGGEVYLGDEEGYVYVVDATKTMYSYDSRTASNGPVNGKPDNYNGPAGISGLTMDQNGNLQISSQNQNEVTTAGSTGAVNFYQPQNVYTTAPEQYIQLLNPGAAALTFSGTPTVTGSFALTTDGTCNFTEGLAAGASCSLGVTFTPTTDGSLTGTIVIKSNATTSPSTVQLSGTGQGTPTLTSTLAPTSLNFTAVEGTTSAAQTSTFTNTGPAAISITSIVVTPNSGFAESDNCGTSLAAGAHCTISATFSPTAATTYGGGIYLTSNTSTFTPTINLTGTGTPSASFPPPPSVANLQFAPAVLNQFAGNFTGAYTGDGGPAIAATLNRPNGIAYDAAGNLYIADATNYVVRKVDTSGKISTFAGNGTSGYTGDGGPATSAEFQRPQGIAIDASGNVYVADQLANVVRKIDTTGKITLFAGNSGGNSGYLGDGGPATSAELYYPIGIAFDPAGNLYIADRDNAAIRMVDTSGNIHTVAGTGTAGYSGDGGPATSAQLDFPVGVAVDAAGNMYIADAANFSFRLVNKSGTISTFAGSDFKGGSCPAGSMPTACTFSSPGDVLVSPGGDIYLADAEDNIYIVDSSGKIYPYEQNTVGDLISTSIGTSDFLAATNGPGFIAFDANNQLIAANSGSNVVTSAGSTGILNFSSQDVYTTSSSKFIQLINPGLVALSFTGTPTITGPYAIVMGGTCDLTKSLAPGASCTLGVTFTPTMDGANPGTIVLDSNATSSPSTIQLNGTGTGSATLTSTISPASLTFTTVANTTSAAQTVTFTNTSPTDITISAVAVTTNSGFAETNNCGATLSAGAHCAIAVTFSPTAATTYSGGLTVTSDSTSPATVSLSGTGTAPAAPAVTFTPTYLTFPTTAQNTTATALTSTLKNTGNAVLNIAGITVTGLNPTDFAQTNNCGSTLAAGASCTISVTFTPTAPGNLGATINVADNATGSPQGLAVSGVGGGGVSASPSSIAFGNQGEYQETNPQKITITNASSATLTFGTLAFTGDFVLYQDDCGSTLLGNSSCYYLVSFLPQGVGSFTGGVSIPYSGTTGSPLTVSFTGTGTAATPMIGLYPLPINFGQLPVSTAATPLTLQVENLGSAPLTGISFSITGANASDYTETDTCSGVTLNPYPGTGACNVIVSFTPSAAGPRVAALNVTSNSGAATFSTPLQGAGVAQPGQVQFTPTQLNLIAGAGGPCADATSGKASTATLCNITGTTQDYLGNTYLVDNTYNVVYKVDTTGALSVFAGTPSKTGGYTGDGGPASSATLSGPTAVAADAFGNIYISDTANSAIRAVDTTGMISSFVGPNCEDNVRSTPMSRKASGKGKAHPNDATIDLCETFQPEGLVVDATGNLIFADALNNVILETNIALGNFGIVAGDTPNIYTFTGTAGYNGDNIAADGAELNAPQDVAVDTAGNIYVADTLNYRVRKVTAATGIITTVAGDGTQGDTGDGATATSAEINAYGVSTDPAGDLFITPGTGGIVRKVDASGNINIFAGNGTGAISGPASTGAVTNAYFARVDNSGDLLLPTGLQLLSAGPDGLLQFGNEDVNSTSAALTVTIENTGDSILHLGTVLGTVTGTDAADFALSGDNCGYQLSPGAMCTAEVTFKPTASGARTASLSIPTDAAGTPQMVLLQGNGSTASAPTATLTKSIDFGTQPEGTTSAAQTITLSNTGTATLNISGITLKGTQPSNFTISNNGCGATLAAGVSCTIKVTFTPTDTIAYAASLSVADDASGSPQTTALTGTGGYVQPVVTLLPAAVDFGNVLQGTTSAVQTITLSNVGTSTYKMTSYGVGDMTNFAVTTNCTTALDPGKSCTFSVTFTPSGLGAFTSNLSVGDYGDGLDEGATLSGTGTTATAPSASLSPTTLAFPATTAGATAAALTTTLSNTGNATLTITGITLTGANTADFAITTTGTTCGATLAAGATCTIAATFTPATAGSFTASISVADNAAGSPQIATLTGTGNAPLATDFTLTATPPVKTVAPGAVAQFTIHSTGVGGAFDNAIQLTASGLPSGFIATFSPASVTPGVSGASSVLSIQTTSQSALAQPHPLHRSPSPWLATLLVIPLLGLRRRFTKLRVLSCLLLVGALAPVLMLTGCGGGYYNIETKTYTVTVTGTSGSTQHSTTVTLTVQQ